MKAKINQTGNDKKNNKRVNITLQKIFERNLSMANLSFPKSEALLPEVDNTESFVVYCDYHKKILKTYPDEKSADIAAKNHTKYTNPHHPTRVFPWSHFKQKITGKPH